MTSPKKKQHQFLKIDDTLYQSVAFRTLSGPALKLWLDLRTQLNGYNNGRIVATMSKLRKRHWNSNDTLQRARDELIRRGLLRYTRRCGPNVFQRASMLAFTDLPTPDNEEHGISASRPTHDYIKWLPAPKTKKRVNRDAAHDGTATRFVTEPSGGERQIDTAPASGDRENEPEPAPVLGLNAIDGPHQSVTVCR